MKNKLNFFIISGNSEKFHPKKKQAPIAPDAAPI